MSGLVYLSRGKRFIRPCIYRKFLYVLFFCLTILLSLNLTAQQLAKDKDKFLGAGSSHYVYRNFYKYFNQITPGNAGKWGSVEYTRGNYNWSNLDEIYDYAMSGNILFKEHVLVWGNQEPGWVSSLNSSEQREAVEDWIKAFAERYPNTSMVDVVNEPFHAEPSYKEALGGDGQTGWDWVITAFELARQYFPDTTKLILNEYNVLHENSVTTNYLKIINLLNERGLIDGIGIQGHYFEFRSDIGSSSSYVWNISTIESNLQRLADTGIPVYITEFDIDEPNDEDQLEQYQIYFPIFWSSPGVKGITLWGYHEDDVWNAHPNTYLITSRGKERPALEWLRTYIALPRIPVLISPDKTTGEQLDPVLIWHSSESAETYIVQISTSREFTSLLVDTTVADTLLQIDSLEEDEVFYWRVAASNEFGTSEFSDYTYFVTAEITSIEDENKIPTEYALLQNYPNPFNPTTSIEYRVSRYENVSLKVFNVMGGETRTLVNKIHSPGSYKIKFNASDLPSGVYFYKFQVGEFIQTRKMLLIK